MSPAYVQEVYNGGADRCVVLDPFGGAATTALVAEGLGRDTLLIDLNPNIHDHYRDRSAPKKKAVNE